MALGSGQELPPISIHDERERVLGFRQYTRQRVVGHLWLAWLSHVRHCQMYGLVQHTAACPKYTSQAALERSYPDWDCCEVHKRLAEVRARLIKRAEDMDNPAPHQDPTVLTTAWWRRVGGRRYAVDQTIVLNG